MSKLNRFEMYWDAGERFWRSISDESDEIFNERFSILHTIGRIYYDGIIWSTNFYEDNN